MLWKRSSDLKIKDLIHDLVLSLINGITVNGFESKFSILADPKHHLIENCNTENETVNNFCKFTNFWKGQLLFLKMLSLMLI